MIRFDKVSFTYKGSPKGREGTLGCQESLQNGGLQDIDLTINKGECVLLCGRSGCGKTTLTRLVNGLIPYFYPGKVTGTTYVDGKDIQDYPMYEVSECVGSVFQNPRSQFFNVDTDSEIAFGMENLTYPRDKMKERIVYMENGAVTAVFSPDQFLSIGESERHKMGLRALDLRKVQLAATMKSVESPVLEIRDLSLFYKKKTVLTGLNLKAAPGEIIGIIGHNGAGKSTFSRTLCGLHTNCTGSILWNGKEQTAKSRLKLSYMVMQDVSYQLFADTLEKECVFGIKHPDQEAAKQAMERLGIYEYRTHHPNTLSGGQEQRTAVAVSMVCRKEILIFDEPTSGLDYDSMIQVVGLFQTLSGMGKVIFVVTHDYEFLAAACTRVVHLDDGKQQEDYPLSHGNLYRLQDFFLRSERRQNFEADRE